jgi:hypothetical protein
MGGYPLPLATKTGADRQGGRPLRMLRQGPRHTPTPGVLASRDPRNILQRQNAAGNRTMEAGSRTMGDRMMKTYTVTYNVTLTIEVQADSADEAERLADRELPSHCDVNCADARGQLGPLGARRERRNGRGLERRAQRLGLPIYPPPPGTTLGGGLLEGTRVP